MKALPESHIHHSNFLGRMIDPENNRVTVAKTKPVRTTFCVDSNQIIRPRDRVACHLVKNSQELRPLSARLRRQEFRHASARVEFPAGIHFAFADNSASSFHNSASVAFFPASISSRIWLSSLRRSGVSSQNRSRRCATTSAFSSGESLSMAFVTSATDMGHSLSPAQGKSTRSPYSNPQSAIFFLP